jgi:hypothetical protein
MYTNRFISLLVSVSLLAVVVLVVRNANATTSLVANLDSANRSDSARAKAAEAETRTMDSATRSYIAWGQAMQMRNTIDSGTRSYIAWGEALEKAKLNALDSGTRSYIAWGEALQAAGKLSDSGACANTTPENIFAGIDNGLDSATRSYIAWGLALQAMHDIEAFCR